MPRTPLVLVCNNRVENFTGGPAQVTRELYMRALREGAEVQPLLLPVTERETDVAAIIERVDGVLLTGSDSNVNPDIYGATRNFEPEYLDKARDATALPLIRAAIAADIPLLAICRGFQELNVVRGGTLHQHVHKLPGMLDHRRRKELSVPDNHCRAAHKAIVQKGGLFESWGLPAEFPVNSAHAQGIDKLGEGLRIEAKAEDGLIEAVSLPGKKFILGVQWHPEGDCFTNAPCLQLFKRFGDMVRAA